MTTVETLRGPVPVEDLGRTLIHEHVWVRNQELELNFPRADWDDAAMLETAVRNMDDLTERGISTFVDLTVLGLGRDVASVLKVAERTSINIVAATGYYTVKDLPMFFHTHGPGRLIDCPDPLIEMFVGDIEEGIAGTGVKAALIKVVTDADGVTPDVERVLQAAAVAHEQTGRFITTHTNAALHTGRLQQEFFRKAGVPLEHVVIGHCGDTTELEYLRELMDNGSTIGLDRFGLEDLLPDADRIDMVAKLCELGYAEQITISHDAPFYSVNRPSTWRRAHTPRWHTTNISDVVLPALREKGVSEETLHTVLVENPARILAGVAG